MANVEFTYDGQNLTIQCRENDTFEKIIKHFCTKVQKTKEQLYFLYNGQILSNYNLTFNQLTNSVDKTRKKMSIIVTDVYYNNNNALILKENKELKEQLNKANKDILEQKAEIEDLKYQITLDKSESVNQINNLLDTIEKKDEQIKQLKEQIKNSLCPNCKKQLNTNNNSIINNNIKFKTFHLINNIGCFNYEGFQIFSLKNDTLIGVLEGPPNTVYENGYFLFKMIFPSDYSFKPPKFIFISEIFHPNISNGIVSVDILMHQWSPAQCYFDKIIISVQSLLDDPNPNDCINEAAAKLYIEDINEYNETVREYTSLYANYSKFLEGIKKLNIKLQTNNEFKYIEEN